MKMASQTAKAKVIKMTDEKGRVYFCPKCKKYVNIIVEVYDWWTEKREFVDGDYELIDSDNGDMHIECGECSAICEER